MVGARLARWSFLVAALPMAFSATVATIALVDQSTTRAEFTWVGPLDLTIALRLDAFSSLIALLVSGIGVLVCIYAAGYFSASAQSVGRFAATLLGFSTAMLGLVLADTFWTMFLFWELTSVTSFLLVGHQRTDAVARTAARRALVITAGGGLVLLAGFVVLTDAAPGHYISDLEPVTGTGATVAAVLILIAAATKSAQVPFHIWLPGAMKAPTPVSAYLHSATMVKAGVVLVAVASPALAQTSVWTPLGVTFGTASMVWGAIGALRHLDAKLILAWGTVSQLGLMIVLLSFGSGKAVFAAVSILFAHAIFKAALFMIVGEIDVRTGTRDIRELSGLNRSMPLAYGVALVSSLSMAGVPPMLGFPAKEAAVEAALGLSGGERTVALIAIIGGSVLTVAYTARFILTVFHGGSGTPTVISPRRSLMAAPAAFLGACTLLGFAFLGNVTDWVRPAAVTVNKKAEVYSLIRWPGLTDAFMISAGIVAAGAVLGWVISRRAADTAPRTIGADTVDASIDGSITIARHIAARVQHGSLPGYVLTMVAVAALATIPFIGAIDFNVITGADNAAQMILAAFVAASAVAATQVRTRLGAALVLGAVGFAVAGLFVASGAPDLVLTQLLVETVIVVGFVLGLGRLTTKFPRHSATWQTTRIGVSAMAAGAVAVGLAGSARGPVPASTVDRLTAEAVSEGGGKNVVNVILTDVRALDTLGEIVVLVVVAVGVLALLRRRPEVVLSPDEPSLLPGAADELTGANR
ncbi:MAG: multicomponent Na+:H+ antiporter subunit A [Ilumatobacter sp.]|jgi:multicomponent Na+:H+ antiporter subunit A